MSEHRREQLAKAQAKFTMKEFRTEWLRLGPVAFAEEYLEVKLSQQQKEFLEYLWKGENPFISLVAPRNSGKTWLLAIFILWLVVTGENLNISVMGGSLKQSSKLQRYIKKWRNDHTQIENIITKFRDSPFERMLETVFGSRTEFLSCTTKSAKGEHGYVFLDEVSEAERELGGREAVDAILGQVFESKTKLVMTSTVDCIAGSFYNIVTNPQKHGFKHFTWDIVEHASKEDPRLHYTDKNSTHWKVLPDCSWIDQEKMEKLRRLKDDGWWLINVLGGITVGSGNVFNSKDIIVINFDQKLPFTDLRIGLDCGFSLDYDPSALVMVGFLDNRVFVLDGDEQNFAKYNDIVDWVIGYCKRWHIWEIYIDPSVSSKPLITLFEAKGYSCPDVADLEATKELRVGNVLSLVEKKKLVIHESCQHLIRSVRSLYFEKETRKIAKVNDHSFDALCYSLVTLDASIFEESTSTLQEKESDKELEDLEKVMNRLTESIPDSEDNSKNVRLVSREKAKHYFEDLNKDAEDD
jgi:hypothetical protein